jgi:hypothetical protein
MAIEGLLNKFYVHHKAVEMDVYKIGFVVLTALCFFAYVRGELISYNDNIRTLNTVIYREVTKPNQLGYAYQDYPCPQYPSLSDSGLTFDICADLYVTHESYTSPLDSVPLFKKIYKDVIDRLNSIRAIRPFLAEFPITPSSCCVYLVFRDEEKNIRRPPYVQSLRLFHEILEINPYRPSDEDRDALEKANVRLPAHEALKEFYEPTLPSTEPGCKIRIPPLKKSSWMYRSSVDQSFFRYLESFCCRNALELTMIGVAGEHRFDSKPFDFTLRGSRCLTLEDARRLAAMCSKELLEFAKTDTYAVALIKERGADPIWKDPATVAEPRHCAFRISFWDEAVDRVRAPATAEIRVNGESFKYFTADAYQRLVLTYEETLAEANAFLEKGNKSSEDTQP